MNDKHEYSINIDDEQSCFVCGAPVNIMESKNVGYCSQECMNEQEKGFEDFCKNLFGDWWSYD